jgi:hypothetical protein
MSWPLWPLLAAFGRIWPGMAALAAFGRFEKIDDTLLERFIPGLY